MTEAMNVDASLDESLYSRQLYVHARYEHIRLVVDSPARTAMSSAMRVSRRRRPLPAASSTSVPLCRAKY